MVTVNNFTTMTDQKTGKKTFGFVANGSQGRVVSISKNDEEEIWEVGVVLDFSPDVITEIHAIDDEHGPLRIIKENFD
ncbi:hypothetical protein EO238_28745, partial [Citrobacter sp. AAK_AS5]